MTLTIRGGRTLTATDGRATPPSGGVALLFDASGGFLYSADSATPLRQHPVYELDVVTTPHVNGDIQKYRWVFTVGGGPWYEVPIQLAFVIGLPSLPTNGPTFIQPANTEWLLFDVNGQYLERNTFVEPTQSEDYLAFGSGPPNFPLTVLGVRPFETPTGCYCKFVLAH